ncbi:hypothetical protein BDB00DRAFT_875974 [Zychaea mexicana]|uniref:uncharacterized protein n=1 Tax=Zychaea mexicana TaxID=64656 RepID=UPI0022FEB8C9|nr:uncharacterized protein BDB00DRAFT_875974 [Zychaea mexicana]KAI9489747.1 hypothetical protein BDB00DRAFT_875974 [Zychaea mexicana]
MKSFITLTTTALGLFAASVSIQFAQARTAIDTVALMPYESYQCAHEEGYEGAAIGCYEENESLSDCPTNYFRARSAGFKDVDLSLRPCTHRGCKSAEEQVQEFTRFANTNKMGYRYLWLHVTSGNWISPQATLSDFKKALDTASENTLWDWGVFTSAKEWEEITGSSSFELDPSVPLWYANHDDQPNFNDFTSFGGWDKPFAKQYSKDSDICSATFSQSYYE